MIEAADAMVKAANVVFVGWQKVDAGLVTRSDLHFAILRRLRAAGIVIPYPQREVRVLKDGES